ncbi:MAG TPA: UDP-glucose/GDP-mannose dehydrogenase family protein [Alphaproteobacteria bacterium]|nr:UDP-glucose/GDP-mannose dehydrogenase family protein [Alphaproteobacteria bacterium]
MKISIFGLGYVGCVTAACLAKAGHEVWGVDVNPEKVALLNEGKSPIVEQGLADMIAEARSRGVLQATGNPRHAVCQTQLSLVCVGTPSNGNGSLDLGSVIGVSRQIGAALRHKSSYHCIVFRSTMLPGTVRKVLIPLLSESSGKRVHRDFDVCFNPEFLREGSSIADFYHPPFTVIGQETVRGGDAVAALYSGIAAPLERTTYEVAEMLKYACNGFHALKVAFANEIGVLCKSLGIDSHRVMELFALDKKLNISAAYLKPGFAFGGSCLPKDLRALLYKAKEMDVATPVLASVLESNRLHIQRVIDRILCTKRKSIGILGLSFKPGTDDLRESPIVALIETLIGKGCCVKIYDADVLPARIFGANKEFIEREIPHISSLMCATREQVLSDAEVIVIGKHDDGLKQALEPYLGEKIIFDLVRFTPNLRDGLANYDGICW